MSPRAEHLARTAAHLNNASHGESSERLHGYWQGVTEGWQACRDWVTSEGTVNLDFLAERFCDAHIWATTSAKSISKFLYVL